MSVRLWGLLVRTEVAALGRALFGRTWTPHSLLHTSSRSTRPTVSKLWQLLRGIATTLKKTNHPRSRVLFGGAVAFLWERERISNDEAISCLKEYDNRVKSHLHVLLQESVDVVPCASSAGVVSTDESNTSHFERQLQLLLQQNSEKHLAQLPLVGLRKMGRLSSASLKAQEALHRVTSEAVSKLSDVTASMYKPLKLVVESDDEASDSGSVEEVCDAHDFDIGRATCTGAEVCQGVDIESQDVNKCVYAEEMFHYYTEHSKRHMAGLPLAGLRHPGRIYTMSQNIANLFMRWFQEDSNIRSQALFLTHLGFSLWDVPACVSFPQVMTGVQVNSAALVTEGFAALSLREALDAALHQAKLLLYTCTSPRLILDMLSGSNMDTEQDDLSKTQGPENCHQLAHESLQTYHNSERELAEGSEISTHNQHVDTDLYLEKSGWEHFADAQSCTVYRKPHASGLYMYKVIGRYTDISVKDFLDVQVDYDCRKQWDTYVEKLETVDMDHETGCEVVHWIMKFPFPMSSREYLYVRRVWLNQNVAVLMNRSVTHPSVPTCRKYVRVLDYSSHTVMQPHTTSSEDGFEYEVTYFDNPQTNLPSSCVNWVATAAMPEFLGKVHSAALRKKKTRHSSIEQI